MSSRISTDTSEDWRATGVCSQVGGDTWFPDRGGSTSDAKRVCHGCPVKGECLEWALANDERFGVWGGLSERERRALQRKRA
ncbi:WhiB family transcriptional regulator [Mycobacteroides abscessus]|uniref:WhiB family transcriptional regulator n=1 Tax=Mycobacteroides abscessus TaxID=36809 RepID=UPI0009A63614|nr:WhiB family transcriptional regulator [Mycobacteroides abscessus]SKO15618.1 WhiB family transcriptional regulator [Mycobacteroides abscessus subsp. bolletii]